MKKLMTALLAAFLCLLTACAEQLPAAEPLEISAPRPDYRFDTTNAQESFLGEDGVQLAEYSYQLLTLAVPNLEELSEADREQAEKNIDAFNQWMGDLLDSSVATGRGMGKSIQEAHVLGSSAELYYDRTTAVGRRVGEILSVRLDNESYMGGAHSNRYTTGYLFDLGAGHFIDPAQLADDPDGFAKAVSELLVQQAEEKDPAVRAGFWPDYKDIISRWNQGTVLLDESGMTVHYSPYELGPYALGTVELHLEFSQLRDLLGPGGQEKLGLAPRVTVGP